MKIRIGLGVVLAMAAFGLSGCVKEQLEAWYPDTLSELQVVGITPDTTVPAAAGTSTSSTRSAIINELFTFEKDDRMSLFMRGETYEDVDNRKVTYSEVTYTGETAAEGGSSTVTVDKWVIDGEEILLSNHKATVSMVYPYATGNTYNEIPFKTGVYNTGIDLLWKRQQVDAASFQAKVESMHHALTRVKIVLRRDGVTEGGAGTESTAGSTNAAALPTGSYTGEGKVTFVSISDVPKEPETPPEEPDTPGGTDTPEVSPDTPNTSSDPSGDASGETSDTYAIYTGGVLCLASLDIPGTSSPSVTGRTPGVIEDRTEFFLSVDNGSATGSSGSGSSDSGDSSSGSGSGSGDSSGGSTSPAKYVTDLLTLPVADLVLTPILLTIVVDGHTMTKTLPLPAADNTAGNVAGAWEAGKCYTYTVTVKNTAVVIDKVTTTEWNEGGTISGDLENQAIVGAYKNGGIVFRVTPDNKDHYIIVSLYEQSLAWDKATAWAKAYGTNWRLPTVDELKEIRAVRYGNGSAQDPAQSVIDLGIIGNGGIAFGAGNYWSSEEVKEGTEVAEGTGSGTTQAKAVSLSATSSDAVATDKTTCLPVRLVKEIK